MLLVHSLLSVLHSESCSWFLVSPPSLGIPFLSPHCIFVSAVPGSPWSCWHRQSLLVSVPQFLGLLFCFFPWSLCLLHPVSFRVIFGLGFCCRAYLLCLPLPRSLSPGWRWGVSRLPVEFLPWEACSPSLHFSLLVSPCVGSCPSGKLSCCRLALRVAPPLRHVLGRRGPVQAGPLPSCHFSPSASSQCLAEAVKFQGTLLPRAK